jgi:DNA-binding IclR family transcriptional regulator
VARNTEGANSAEAGVRSVTRVIDLLELFDTGHPTRPLRELVEGTELPKTTVVRLVSTLCGRGVLALRSDGSYSLGPELLRWTRLAGATWRPPEEVLEVMRQLSVDTGETANLYVRQGIYRIVVAQRESTSTVRSVIPVGVPYPMWMGAAGKILLLDEPDLVDEVVADSPYGPEFGDKLRAQIEGARTQGYVVVHGERELGSSALSCPIRGAKGNVVAALSLGGPTGRFTADRMPRYIEATTSAAGKITAIGLRGLDY